MNELDSELVAGHLSTLGYRFTADHDAADVVLYNTCSVRERAEQHRDIVIFPEGTRRPPGAPPDYKSGVVALYEGLELPCVPVALNSGVFWPRRSLRKRSGTIVVELLEPIPPGLPRAEFRRLLIERTETASERLRLEAERELELAQPNATDPANLDREQI